MFIPDNFFGYIYHFGCAINLHSITNSGLIPAVNPMNKEHRDPHELDLTKPRLASYKQKKWNRHQDTVYWVDIQRAQRKGSKFYQTRCTAIIHYDTLPAYCISKVVVMESGEVIYQKVYVSPRPPPKISYKDNWMKNWIHKSLEAAKIPNESNQNQKFNDQERGDRQVDKNPPRRSIKVS